jgi:hypothetical protein
MAASVIRRTTTHTYIENEAYPHRSATMHIASSTPTAARPTLPLAVEPPKVADDAKDIEIQGLQLRISELTAELAAAHVAAPAPDRFDRPSVPATPSPTSGAVAASSSAPTSPPARADISPYVRRYTPDGIRSWALPGTQLMPRNPSRVDDVVDLGSGSERSSYSKTIELYSGPVTAGLINQRGPMAGNSHTSSRETAVASLEFVDKRNFFLGADYVIIELVPQHTIIERSTMGGQLVEQRRTGVLDHSQATRVRLDLKHDGVYRASAGATNLDEDVVIPAPNKAFLKTTSESGLAPRRILEDIKVTVSGTQGYWAPMTPAKFVEDTAYGARYGGLV